MSYRNGNRIRSYIRAAYAVAKAAKSKASIPVHFKAYGVTHNPAAETSPDESANKADKNPLSLEEARRYWKAIKDTPGIKGAALRLHLLTGGQRIEQLCSLLTSDVNLSTKPESLTIFDGKGRSGKPARTHVLPLIPAAVQALQDLNPQGEFALSTDGGKTRVSPFTLARWAQDVAAAAGIEEFQAKRIRSGVETALSKRAVSKEHRGRLQSHGISGVQDAHYDGHDYMGEKLEALETLFHALENEDGAKIFHLKKSA